MALTPAILQIYVDLDLAINIHYLIQQFTVYFMASACSTSHDIFLPLDTKLLL